MGFGFKTNLLEVRIRSSCPAGGFP